MARRAMSTQMPTVAISESCTGGMVMARIVDIPGSGSWFKGGLVAYDEAVKFELLGVTPGPVVTAATALQMAQGIRELLGTNWGVSTTGEAGPMASESAPVGTLYIGVVGAGTGLVHHTVFPGSPEEIRVSATDFAVSMVLERVGIGDK
jgi:PncC family amidohydrolase